MNFSNSADALAVTAAKSTAADSWQMLISKIEMVHKEHHYSRWMSSRLAYPIYRLHMNCHAKCIVVNNNKYFPIIFWPMSDF